jgi:hypothetical protein
MRELVASVVVHGDREVGKSSNQNQIKRGGDLHSVETSGAYLERRRIFRTYTRCPHSFSRISCKVVWHRISMGGITPRVS